MTERNWYRMRRIEAKGDKPAAGEVDIYDEIGFWGIRAADFIRDLKALGEVATITVAINSPGGEVFDGLAIHNALRRHSAKVTCRVDGIAASIASVIAMAGDEVAMPENAMLMIHDPSGLVWGTAEDMRDLADALDKIKTGLVSAYRDKSGLSDEEIAALMAEETWLTAAEAKAKGFCDVVLKPVKMAASASDLTRRFKNLPAALAAVAPPSASAEPVAEHSSMTEQKKPEAGAKAAEASIDVDKIKAEAEQAAATKQQAYATEVGELCALAGMPGKAMEFVAKGTPIADVRKALIDARAKGSAAEVDNHHVQGAGQAANHGWDKVTDKVVAQLAPKKR